jgi:hypothetical protein
VLLLEVRVQLELPDGADVPTDLTQFVSPVHDEELKF